jgi:hypothetical protein
MISAACTLYFAYKYDDAILCVKRLKEQSSNVSKGAIRRVLGAKYQ